MGRWTSIITCYLRVGVLTITSMCSSSLCQHMVPRQSRSTAQSYGWPGNIGATESHKFRLVLKQLVQNYTLGSWRGTWRIAFLERYILFQTYLSFHRVRSQRLLEHLGFLREWAKVVHSDQGRLKARVNLPVMWKLKFSAERQSCHSPSSETWCCSSASHIHQVNRVGKVRWIEVLGSAAQEKVKNNRRRQEPATENSVHQPFLVPLWTRVAASNPGGRASQGLFSSRTVTDCKWNSL